MSAALPLGPGLPATVPADVRLLGRLGARRGLSVPPGTVLLGAVPPQPADVVVRPLDARDWHRGPDLPPGTAGALVLRDVGAVHSGTAVREGALAYDVVHALEGGVTELRPGAVLRELHVPRHARHELVHRGADPWRTPLPPWGMRLARVLRRLTRQVRDVREVTWADDGHVCWLLGVTGTMEG